MDVNVKYFETGGNHTSEVLEHVKPVVESRKIKDIIIATTRGDSGLLAIQAFDPKQYNVVCVTHSDGFAGPNKQELKQERKENLVAAGAKILTATHSLSGVETGISKALAGGNIIYPVEMFARLVRLMLGDGVKVCMEIAIMAADAGLITDVTKDVLCIGGTGTGADTACIVLPAYTRSFSDLRVKQVLCKPEVARP